MIQQQPKNNSSINHNQQNKTITLHTFQIQTIQQQTNKKLHHHTPTTANIKHQTKPTHTTNLQPPQIHEQIQQTPNTLKTTHITNTTHKKILINNKQTNIHITNQINKTNNPPNPTQIQTKKQLTIHHKIKKQITNQHNKTITLQPIIKLTLLNHNKIQLIPNINTTPQQT